ncbi:MAG: hypothetical protein LUE61_11515 [Clostridiales bacterium]|nr:hypothetical protein [Clostridiales bacterium]
MNNRTILPLLLACLLALPLTACQVEFSEPTSVLAAEQSSTSGGESSGDPAPEPEAEETESTLTNGVDSTTERTETITVNDEAVTVSLFTFRCSLGFIMEYPYETFRCAWDEENQSAVFTSDLTDEDGVAQGVLTVSRGAETVEATIEAVEAAAGDADLSTGEVTVGQGDYAATELSYTDSGQGCHVAVYVFENEGGDVFQMELRYTDSAGTFLLPRMALMRQCFQFVT